MRAYERGKEVERMRHVPIAGSEVILEPYQGSADREHAQAVAVLRADRAFTVESQLEWHRRYLDRNDEIAWVVRDYENRILAATALERIDLERGQSAILGRMLFDRELRPRTIARLEVEHLVLEAAFDALDLRVVCTPICPENRRQLAIHDRLGFVKAGWIEADEVRLMMDLDRDRFDRRALERARRSRRATLNSLAS